MCTRAQGLFAHATAPGAPTVDVTPAKPARYKHICASDPENVCTLLAASPTQLACRLSTTPAAPIKTDSAVALGAFCRPLRQCLTTLSRA